ncbi:hypothetical protein [uncultured Tateyamaria sp.]|nr:hypothetical protein [uncultured Tateyamaria sp.]
MSDEIIEGSRNQGVWAQKSELNNHAEKWDTRSNTNALTIGLYVAGPKGN